MAIRNEYTLPNGSKLRVAGNNLKEVGVVLSAIGNRLQDLLERRLTGLDFVHQINFDGQFDLRQDMDGKTYKYTGVRFRESSPVTKVQITICTLFGGTRKVIIEAFEYNGARTWTRMDADIDTLSKAAVFLQRRGRKAQYGKNCHCQVCQGPVLEEHLKPHRVCDACTYIVIN
uniref:Uncharacterized protein n=1 Tax=Pantoea phage Survivor TaxID=3232176 RepID=A0AAU8L0V5_9CAUD